MDSSNDVVLDHNYNRSQAVGHCKSCSVAGGCDPAVPTPPAVLGCSNTMFAEYGRRPCCDLCCPENMTEDFYAAHPEAYKQHPPTFLVQNTAIDENADTCAAKNYHQSMVENGGKSHLALIPFEYERCSCVGQPEDATSAGSPYRQHCPDFPTLCFKNGSNATLGSGTGAGTSNFVCHLPPKHEDVHDVQRCEMHTMGFSGMVEPLVAFLMDAVARK